MTVSTGTRSITYVLDGVTTAFTIPFPWLDDTWMTVSKNGNALSYGADYTLAGEGESTGTITLTSAGVSGDELTVERVVPLVQPTRFRNRGAFLADDIEVAFDRLTMAIQQVNVDLATADDTYFVNLANYGAVGDGSTDNTTAIRNWLAALTIGIVSGERRNRKGYAPAGVYLHSGNISIETGGGGYGISIFGDGDKNTIFQCSALTGDALTIAGDQWELADIGVYATAERKAGGSSGRGIYINASLSTTSARGKLRNVHVLNQPGIGVEGVRIEQHTFDGVWVSNCLGRGFYLNAGAGQSSWNLFLNCRAQGCGGVGFEMTDLCINNTVINQESLNCSGSSLMIIHGRGNIVISPDTENPTLVTGATSYVGIEIRGTRHRIISPLIFAVNTGIRNYASLTEIWHPLITNDTTGVTGVDAVSAESGSANNVYYLPTSAGSFTNVLTPATGRTNDTIISGSTFGVTGTWTPDLRFNNLNVGMTYSSRTGTYTKIGNMVHVTFDVTLSALGSSTGNATIDGLPFTASASGRWMADVAVLAGGVGLTNFGAAAASPGTTGINLRSQTATTFAETTHANYSGTTRIVGSCSYQI